MSQRSMGNLASESGLEQSETRSNKGRGMSRRSIDLIAAIRDIAEATQPITGRGIGYKLFSAGLIPSMSQPNMQRVYRLLKEARERGIVPWHWITDETRELEQAPSWNDPEQYARAVVHSYRRDFWNFQPLRIEVWSEKGTVRGVLAPVLDEYRVGFRVLHGFSGATTIHDVAQDDDGRELLVLYVGDYDPSGMYMSERDLPERLAKYGGGHVTVRRIALLPQHLEGLPSFPASDKTKDPRYSWFVREFGKRCWELDALDPNTLRSIVDDAIQSEIDSESWAHCAATEEAERELLRIVIGGWTGAR